MVLFLPLRYTKSTKSQQGEIRDEKNDRSNWSNYRSNGKWKIRSNGIKSIIRGAMDMKQHKHLIFLICGTVIVTSGLAILPWFIV